MRLVRRRQALIVALAGGLAVLQTAAAADTRAPTRRFIVTVRATITKEWTYTTPATVNGCASQIVGSGRRILTLRSDGASTVTASWAGGKSRARFSGRVSLAGTLVQTGTKTIRTPAGNGCDGDVHSSSCTPVRRTFADHRIGLVSRRRHRLGFTRLTGVVPRSVYTTCPGEPAGVRALSSGLEAADTSYSERELFDRATAGLTLEGDADVSTKLLGSPGNVVQHVRWTLLFRRVR
jgi:hypothetical protein